MCFSHGGRVRLKGLLYKRGPQWRIFNRADKDVCQKEEHDLTSLITKDHNRGSLHKGTKWGWKLKLHLKWKSGKGEGGEGVVSCWKEGGSNYNPELPSLWVRCDTTLWNRHKTNWFCLSWKKKTWIWRKEPERKKEH